MTRNVALAALAATMLASSALAYTYPTAAQTSSAAKTATPSITTGACDPLHLFPGCGGIASGLNSVFGQLADFLASDFASAQQLATAVPGLQDYTGAQCWQTMSVVGKLLQAHPLPATLKAATDFEALRLAGAAVNTLCASPACTQVFTDASAVVTAAAPIGITVPSLASLCAKIPHVTLGNAPAALPAPASAPPAATTPVHAN